MGFTILIIEPVARVFAQKSGYELLRFLSCFVVLVLCFSEQLSSKGGGGGGGRTGSCEPLFC